MIAGQTIGPYSIVAKLGEGGMGEVYRARDTRLQRDVALKLLPPTFATDPDRLARFTREAQTLAALNHSNIAQIYGLDETATGPVLVIELVEGETLAERIARDEGRGLPLDEALAIARQIAEALEAAHERGIVHRDLKPANVKLRPDGTVKVLDFGLAKAVETWRADAGESGLANSPTFTANATQAGMILRSAAYMAPEQATGKPVDRRADIWAFGCVLFEMLTGRGLFHGNSVSEILAAVLRDALPLHTLPATTPPGVRRLLDRCLQREPKKRLRDIGDARLELDAVDNEPEVLRPTPQKRSVTKAVATWGALTIALAGLAGAAGWLLKPSPSIPLRKLEIAIPATGVSIGTVRLSPDGTRLAYVAGDRLFVRRLDTVGPHDLGPAPSGTELLAWSPDSTMMALVSGDGKLRKIAAAGGPLLVVSDLPDTRRAIGLVWLDSGIVAAVWRSSLYRVDPRGGSMSRWLALDAATEIDFHALAALPEGRVVFATHRQNNEYPLESFDGTNRVVLHPPSAFASLAYSPTGHLLGVKGGDNHGLWAIPFDRQGLAVDDAVLVAPKADWVTTAADGTILFVSTDSAGGAFELVAVNRAGQGARVLKSSSATISTPAVSPDGRRVAFVLGAYYPVNTPTGSNKRSVWLHQLDPPAEIRLTPEEGDFGMPAWFPGGDRVVIIDQLSQVGRDNAVTFATDGSGTHHELGEGGGQVTPEGDKLLFAVEDRGMLRLRRGSIGANGRVEAAQKVFAGDPEPTVCCYDRFALSPSGRLLAYIDVNQSGQATLLLTRFPSAEGRWHVATGQGRDAFSWLRWARKTNELFFFKDAGAGRVQLVAVTVTDGDTVVVSPPTSLFDASREFPGGGYDVSPDGTTFYLARRVAATTDTPKTQRYVVIQNWAAELETKR
jgi:serine/threonine protein kinase/dipeptidyl aminopeptidase/acylaminoacyl peptidase